MAEQRSSPQTAVGSAATAAVSPPSASLFGPAIYPFEVVQKLLDQTAYFPLYAFPVCKTSSAIGRGSYQCGIQATEVLHRFQMYMDLPNGKHCIKAMNIIGEFIGRANLRWAIIPENFAAAPDLQPPTTQLDPSRSQRFMQQTELSFAAGRDAFRCFGTGRTFPDIRAGGAELLVAASGDITEGVGIFKDTQGTCIFLGRLDPQTGFIGSIIARTVDSDGNLTAALPPPECHPEIELEAAYFLFRGQQQDPSPIAANPATQPAGGQGGGFALNQVIRAIYPDCSILGAGRLRSSHQVGAIIGNQVASIQFDPSQLATLRTPYASIPFRGENTFTFVDDCGHNIGSIHAVASDGSIFNLRLAAAPLQRGVRIAGYGPALGGTGALSGVEGLFHSVAFNALPPIPSSLYVLRIADPHGTYRE